MGKQLRRIGLVVALVGLAATCLVGLPLTAQASTTGYAPINKPGPALTVPPTQLAQSLSCTAGVRHADREPVLLLPATTVDSTQNYGFDYEPLFKTLGIPYCTSNSPVDPYNMGDMQVRAQYVTYDIRQMYQLAGRKIAVLGHSQGGMIMRWSLRFWPDTRAMVDDVVGMAGTNHGSIVVPVLCLLPCAPSLWQQRAGSAFMNALNSGQETFPGISYTEIYSHTDEFVQPNLNASGTSSLHGGGGTITNVAVQDICPLDVSEHLLIGTMDPVASALVIDALTHPGPADPARINRDVCGQLFMPGVNPVTGPFSFAATTLQVAEQLVLAPRTAAEPALACYVTATCPAN
jgi:hypothetical protein